MSWITTYTGRRFDPGDIREEAIALEDIAHALGNLCRFTGHCARFYSVAEHSCHVSDHAPHERSAWGLLHDAAEAYIADLNTPIKRRPGLEGYSALEDEIQAAIAKRFGVKSVNIKPIDQRLLVTEAEQLLPQENAWRIQQPQYQSIRPIPMILPCWSPETAKAEFLARARKLGIR